MINIKVDEGNTRITVKKILDNATNLNRIMQLALLFLQDKVDKNLATGKFNIKTRTGMLRASLETKVSGSGQKTVGILGTNLIYARIQEQGGDIYPRTAKFLHFFIGGKEIFTKHVRIPAHWYLRKTMQENKAWLNDFFAKNIIAKGAKA